MVSLKLPSISLCNAIKKQTNFQLQQPPLGLSAIGKADKFTIGTHYSMAGDDEQQGILVAGHAHGAACSGVAYGGGYLSVGACSAIGYLLQSPPHTLLKGSAHHTNGEVQLAAITPKECRDLMLHLAQQGSGRRGCASSVGELDAYDEAALFSETDGSDGSVEGVCHQQSLYQQIQRSVFFRRRIIASISSLAACGASVAS